MLTTISILTCLIFAAIYPLCFWLVRGHPINDGFRRFNLILINLCAGLALFVILYLDTSFSLKRAVVMWEILLLSVSWYSWKRTNVNLWAMTLVSLTGIGAIMQVQQEFIVGNSLALIATILGGMVLCLAIFAMILGHWYLNVSGLPIEYLRKTTYVFWAFLCLRLLWDVYIALTQKIVYLGDPLLLYQFMARLDGFLLALPILFGTIFPVILLYFVDGTLKVKSTQSATGILYVIVSMVLMGDLSYRYYLLKFSIAL